VPPGTRKHTVGDGAEYTGRLTLSHLDVSKSYLLLGSTCSQSQAMRGARWARWLQVQQPCTYQWGRQADTSQTGPEAGGGKKGVVASLGPQQLTASKVHAVLSMPMRTRAASEVEKSLLPHALTSVRGWRAGPHLPTSPGVCTGNSGQHSRPSLALHIVLGWEAEWWEQSESTGLRNKAVSCSESPHWGLRTSG
jgi:hypothetical protein